MAVNQLIAQLAILASGNGTNAEAIMRHFASHPHIRVVMLLSNNPNAYALERARKLGVPTKIFKKEQLRSGEVAQWLADAGVTHVVLAGFLWLIPPGLIGTYPNRIINIHPALLPKYGGKGMYGEHVHQAVKEAGEKRSGITIHLVNEHFDEGRIIFQADCELTPSDTPQSIAEKVHALEYRHYPSVIEAWATPR